MNELKTTEIKTVKHLMFVLGSELAEIEHLINNKESYYYAFPKPKKDKRGQVKLDAEGNVVNRILNPSGGRLREIQQIIAKSILSKIKLLPNVKGGVKGQDNSSNAKEHLGKKYKFKSDMKRYFPSITPDRVFSMFLQNGFSTKVSTYLTHLTTYKYELPQGISTSSYIANLVFLPYDKVIVDYCKEHNLTYTRYVDDLVFSSQLDFRNKCNDIISLILESGFWISYGKTEYRAGDMIITGILTKQNVLDVSDEFKELMNDETIDEKITTGRKNYYKKVRKTSKR